MLLSGELSSHCISDHRGCYDLARAKDFLRSYVCLFYELLKKDYSDKINVWKWEQQIAEEAIEITLKVWSSFDVGPVAAAWVETLLNAVVQHVGQPLRGQPQQEIAPVNPFHDASYPLPGKQAASYALAGIDISSGSPLLMMAHTAAQESVRRGETAHAFTAPKRRIPRSIHSESAAKKLEDYLNAKGLSQTQFAIQINVNQKTLYRFRRTGNVGKSVAQDIAQAMGTTLEEFIS